jgi:hypothetical protein
VTLQSVKLITVYGILFFLKKEPKTLALRGFNSLKVQLMRFFF